MTYKSIFKGRLDFGNSKSYDKVLKMYQHRVESYYKQDILLEEEEIFDHENYSLVVPRLITQGTVKSFRNTVSVLEYVAQFAVAGEMGAWMTENGVILNYGWVEPNSERVAVQSFLKGRRLTEEKGKESEAVEALDRAIEKYEKHSQAYEKRAFVKMQLKDYKSALIDYNKSIDCNPSNTEAFYGRALAKTKLKIEDGKLDDLEKAIKTSIPLQPIYWQARKMKAHYYLEKNDQKGALLDLKLYCNRKFNPEEPNAKWLKYMWFEYGKALTTVGEEPRLAEAAFTKALDAVQHGRINDADILKARGDLRKEHGFVGGKSDLKKSSSLAVVSPS